MIYLVRHGQTEFNAAGRFQGQVNSDLTELGRQQAGRVGARLAEMIGLEAFRIYASPLGRAYETAKIIAGALPGTPEITLDPRLMEIGMGSWDGLTTDEIEACWPGARDRLSPQEWFFHSPDGERYGAFSLRLAAALADISADNAPHQIIVSHGVAGRVMRGVFAGLDKAQSLALDVPQDAIFALTSGGVIERIAC